jgi:ring-1,2-phenylacetyl-CoA epoxidase subunit PaaD
MVTSPVTSAQILDWLQEVKDPEIPTISVVDLGVITEVGIDETGAVTIEMIPTFSGCPAIHFMQMQIEVCLKEHNIPVRAVTVNRNKAWSSNNLTERGRQQLLDFGLSPPPQYVDADDDTAVMNAICPVCRSTDTRLMTPFGPTLCRAIHHCNQCYETFEQFKPV